jgi:hypothetical protein
VQRNKMRTGGNECGNECYGEWQDHSAFYRVQEGGAAFSEVMAGGVGGGP